MNKSHYELTYIIDGNIPETENSEISQKIQDFIKSKNGEITLFQEFGRKKLSYEIKKSSKGTYFVIEFEIEPNSLKSMEKDLKLEKGILRYIILNRPRNMAQVNPDNVRDQSEIKLDKEKRDKPQSKQEQRRNRTSFTHTPQQKTQEVKEEIKAQEESKEEIKEQVKQDVKEEEIKEEIIEKKEEKNQVEQKDDKDDLDKKLDELLNKDEF